MKKIYLMLALVVSFIGQQTIVHAQQEKLEEIRVIGELSDYSATKSDTPILETARSISIETEQQLIDIGAIELADAYTYSAGVTGETFGFATRGDWVRVRGLDVPQYQDSLQSLFGNYNNTRPEVYTLEQVEILKGPASVLYGQGTPGGIVNVITKRPNQYSGNEVVVTVGNYDYLQVGADLNGKLDSNGKWLYRLVALNRDSETQINFVEDNATVISPSISYNPSDDTQISLLLNYQESEADSGAQFLPIAGTLIAAPNGQFISSDFFAGEPEFSQYDGETKSVTLLADHQFNSAWSTQATARHTEGERDYQQAWTSFIGGDRYVYNADGSLYENGTVPRSFYQLNAISEQDALDLRFRADLQTGDIQHEIMIGSQYQDVVTQDGSAYGFAIGYDFATGGPDAVFGDTYWINVFDPVYGNVPPQELIDSIYFDAPEVNVKDLGIYINDQMTIGDLYWNIGLRHDDVENESSGVSQDDSATSISTGLLYAFDNGLSPYISYAESFETVVGLDEVTQNTFKPQEGEQLEVGVKWDFLNNGSFLTLAYFDIEQSNFLEFTLTGQTQNEGISKVSGWELESKFDFGVVDLEVNLSSLETQDADGFQFPSVPEDQASLWLGYGEAGQDGLRAGVGIRYVGSSFGGLDLLETPSYTLLDAVVSYQLNDHWNARLNIRNLADEEYQSTCLARGDCFQGERRTVIGSVNYNF